MKNALWVHSVSVIVVSLFLLVCVLVPFNFLTFGWIMIKYGW